MPSTRGTYRDERLAFARILTEWRDAHRIPISIGERAILIAGTPEEAHFVRTLLAMDSDHLDELDDLARKVRKELE
jgi:hypothetical protein